MENLFISNIRINQVRHLHNIDIFLSSTEKRHLIITGKNGSGKTSILSNIRNTLAGQILGWNKSPQDALNYKSHFTNGLVNIQSSMQQLTDNMRNNNQGDYGIDQARLNIESYQRIKRDYENIVAYLDGIIYGNPSIILSMGDTTDLPLLHTMGQYVVHFFDAKRTAYVGNPTGIQGENINTTNSVLNSANPNFLQYIVNLRAEQSFARDEGDTFSVNNIQFWFANFTKQLADLFGDDSLKLKFDRRRFNFMIELPNRSPFDFNTMSDGYSAILSIVTEIMMRMKNNTNNYDIQGIVLIDEIETHLHIELQKKVLPFLISFFPNLQFVVSSHSPFILNSISNAVVYDLEKNIRVEDLSGYSLEGIVEGYFRQDKYSEEVKSRLDEFEQLALNKNRNPEEQERYRFLKKYFKELPKFYSEELELKLNQIQLAEL